MRRPAHTLTRPVALEMLTESADLTVTHQPIASEMQQAEMHQASLLEGMRDRRRGASCSQRPLAESYQLGPAAVPATTPDDNASLREVAAQTAQRLRVGLRASHAGIGVLLVILALVVAVRTVSPFSLALAVLIFSFVGLDMCAHAYCSCTRLPSVFSTTKPAHRGAHRSGLQRKTFKVALPEYVIVELLGLMSASLRG